MVVSTHEACNCKYKQISKYTGNIENEDSDFLLNEPQFECDYNSDESNMFTGIIYCSSRFPEISQQNSIYDIIIILTMSVMQI